METEQERLPMSGVTRPLIWVVMLGGGKNNKYLNEKNKCLVIYCSSSWWVLNVSVTVWETDGGVTE